MTRLILAMLLCTVAARGAVAREPVRSLYEMRTERIVMQKWDNSCGAAALATLLTYDLHRPIAEEQVARGMMRQTDPLKVKVRGGFSLLDMKRFARQLGLESDGYSDLTLETLPEFLPAIIPIKVRGYDHFVVVREIAEGRVRLADPGFGNYSVGTAKFERIWPGIAFVVAEPGAEGRP